METSIRPDSISRIRLPYDGAPLRNVSPRRAAPVRMAIVSGFEIRVVVLHDSGPPVPRERDVEMAYAAPIGRIDGVKSLVPRQFLADFATEPARSVASIGKPDVNRIVIAGTWAISIYYSSLTIFENIDSLFLFSIIFFVAFEIEATVHLML